MTTGTVSSATLGILGTQWQAATRDEEIDLESGEYVPVGHFWKFDLEKHETRNFGRKFNFSSFRMEPVMPNVLATTENIRFTIAGKYFKKAAGNCYSQFPDTK